MYSNAEMEIAPAILACEEIPRAIESQICFVGMGQVRRSPDHPGNISCQYVESFTGGVAGRHALGIGGKDGQMPVPSVPQLCLLHFPTISGPPRRPPFVIRAFSRPPRSPIPSPPAPAHL